MAQDNIVLVYGTIECHDTQRVRRFLASHNIPYEFIDILSDAEGAQLVERVTGGEHVTPVVLFPDGTTLVEPSDEQIARHLGIARSS
jgi:glutaredoxin